METPAQTQSPLPEPPQWSLYARNRYHRLTPEQRKRKNATTASNRRQKRASRIVKDPTPVLLSSPELADVATTFPHPSYAYLQYPYYTSNPDDVPRVSPVCNHALPSPTVCSFCEARCFQYEPPLFCCSGGKINLPGPDVPTGLRSLFSLEGPASKEFRENIRVYNSIFAFTSFGVNLDRTLASSRQGVYTFRAQGQTYHDLPPLLPTDVGPRFFQLYFFDTANELQNRMNIMRDAQLAPSIIETVMDIMSANPYSQTLRRLEDMHLDTCELRIRSDPSIDQRIYNRPTADQVAAIWIEGPDSHAQQLRDIVVHAKSGQWHRIKHYYGCYDPLQYPLLFPFGESGWHQNIYQSTTQSRSAQNADEHSFGQQTHSASELIALEEQFADNSSNAKKVSCRQYYCYKLQIRDPISHILLAGRLLQQYIVDMYIKLESTRLDYYTLEQTKIRADLYQGIVDSVMTGETSGANIGKRVVLPASFIGGPRDMRRRYLDAMSLVQHFGKPDLFITMTCNPEWQEIRDNIEPFQTPQDRPDVVARVFRAKLQDLKDLLYKKQIFGGVAAHVHVVEFQKRGLPHAHILLILKPQFKICTTDQFDRYVCAEIPDKVKYPALYAKVVKHMLHGPCGGSNTSYSCMKGGKCKYYYPRPFCNETMLSEDSYPIYRRRDDGKKVSVRGGILDNTWVVPYNPYLLSRYDCHINVEICSGIRAVKYLYKYIYKGHDRVEFNLGFADRGLVHDEIKQFQEARFVSAIEGIWRIYEFELNEIHPSVCNLQLHLPNKQVVYYWENQNLQNYLNYETSGKTMLTEFFTKCSSDSAARLLLYKEFPEHFVWNKKAHAWTTRQQGQAIGRVNSANPIEGERYYLRLLLNNVRGPTSYADLLFYEGINYPTFKAAALARGLLASDNNISQCLAEAVTFQMPHTLRRLFATILVYCEPIDVRKLWDDNYEALSEDFANQDGATETSRLSATLHSLSTYLESMGKDITSFDLPDFPTTNVQRPTNQMNAVADELAVVTPPEDVLASNMLNSGQLAAFNSIIDRVNYMRPGVFFVDGPGGTGKTFLYRALLATVRVNGNIALATASSGVAASILPGGRTAHSRFAIPLNGDESTTCELKKQSAAAEVIRMAKLIIWDEAPMAKRWNIEVVDRALQDIMDSTLPFGGKVIVFGGDFRQVLPVVPRGTRAQCVDASLVSSFLWPMMEKLYLTENMRAQSDQAFSSFLLRIGNGEEQGIPPDLIQLPSTMLVPNDSTSEAETTLINTVYPSLCLNSDSVAYLKDRAILATKNKHVDMLNDRVISILPGESHFYQSYDEAFDDTNNFYPEEFLNTLMPSGFPPHKLELKVNASVMLLRNIDPSNGLCNGTRLVCRAFERNVIHAEISSGQHTGQSVFLHRIAFVPVENEGFPFRFKRTQFPIRLAFAMTINRAQGQTIPHVGVYLPEDVFSHGQLYVALSRGTSMATTKVLLKNTQLSTYTRNIVYQEVLNR